MARLYENGIAVEKNIMDAFYWDLKGRLMDKYLIPCAASTFSLDGDFQQELLSLQSYINEKVGPLLYKYQLEAKGNQEDIGFRKVAYTIPELQKTYGFLESCIGNAIATIHDLSKAKPGFMVTAVCPRAYLDFTPPKQTPLCLSRVMVGATADYLIIGEENVRLLTQYQNLCEQLDKADQKLEKLAKRYRVGLDSLMGELMTLQYAARLSESEAVMKLEDGSKKLAKDYLKDSPYVVTPEEFEKRKQALKCIKPLLKQQIREIAEEREVLSKVNKDLEQALLRGVGSRNKAFQEEYPEFK